MTKYYWIQPEVLGRSGEFAEPYYRSETDLVGGQGEGIADYSLAGALEHLIIPEPYERPIEIICPYGYRYKVRAAYEEEYNNTPGDHHELIDSK